MKTWIEVHPDRLRQNLRLFREKTAARIMMAVKANAYGHGLDPVIPILHDSPDLDYLAVDSVGEGLRCQELGARQPIVVIGWSDRDELEALLAAGLETAAASLENLKEILRAARRVRRPARIHLKIETGTSRLGIDPKQLSEAAAMMDSPGIEWVGAYSHFANIEDTTDSSYAMGQLAVFRKALAGLAKQPKLKHFSCSASTLLFPETHFDMVRIGISAYGYWPSKQTYVSALEKHQQPLSLQPCLSWQARIAQVKILAKGTPVGYGLTYKTLHPTRLAVIPIGYCDGYDRRLSNVAHVLLRGIPAPVRGRIWMNMFMVEVTHIPRVKAGEIVTLLGGPGVEKVTADTLADWAGTINYEILSRLSPLIPRRCK
jgi:alanine racemase